MNKDKILDGVAIGFMGIIALAFLVFVIWAVVASGGWFLLYMLGVALFCWSLMRVTKKW